jgi:hypothetical protein
MKTTFKSLLILFAYMLVIVGCSEDDEALEPPIVNSTAPLDSSSGELIIEFYI